MSAGAIVEQYCYDINMPEDYQENIDYLTRLVHDAPFLTNKSPMIVDQMYIISMIEKTVTA